MSSFEMGLVGLTLLALVLVYNEKIDDNALISKCEEQLPRTQHCVLIAVPELEVREQE